MVGVDLQVHYRLRLDAVDECDGSALDDVAVAHKDHVAASEIRASHDDRIGRGSDDAQIRGALNADGRADGVQFRCGTHGDIQPDIVGKALRRRRRRHSAELRS